MKLREAIKALDLRGFTLIVWLIVGIFESGEFAATESSYIITSIRTTFGLVMMFFFWFVIWKTIDLIVWLWMKFVRKPRLEEEKEKEAPIWRPKVDEYE